MAGWLGEVIGEVGAPGAAARNEGLHQRAPTFTDSERAPVRNSRLENRSRHMGKISIGDLASMLLPGLRNVGVWQWVT